MRRLALFTGLAFMVSTALAQTLPTGFFMSDVSSGSTWSAPVGTAFTPDGQRLFVWEKMEPCTYATAGKRQLY
jgi:hypothetical protein